MALPTDEASSPDDIEMHVIGHDDNVKRKPMETVAEESQQVIIRFKVLFSLTQQSNTCSTSAMKALEKGSKYVQC